ncbi:serine hydrolase [Fructobacillus sp. M1-13]|uniref:D-alanyl-D-alanine carboxypeptidase n=1 Tax=Fructobacillus papyriferae TaxID=2713171 RepID=A0ABS5QN77_9LACO|nr:serine hydrolase [Fructobacillus papyriferae]MBS9334538.1 D-alanyl-D-alanine carboxypeptidase [Fructobacillus papyriferae]MCD2158527.1 serine hydrolase [Fructobacillus papyriferae]
MYLKNPFRREKKMGMTFRPAYTSQKEKKPLPRFLKIVIILFLSILILGSLGYVGTAYVENRDQIKASSKKLDGEAMKLHVKARNAFVIDANTGQILGQKNPDQVIGIASQSKMLTAYAVLQAIDDGDYQWDTPVKFTKSSDWSDKDAAMYAHLDVKEGETLTVKELFTAMFTTSANDASLALADFAKKKSESQQEFLERWAKKLGLKDTVWYNAAGQVNDDAFSYKVKSAKKTAENKATPRDLAMLAYQIVKDYPDIKDFYKKRGLVYTPNGEESNLKIKLTEGGKFEQEIASQLNNPKNLTVEGLKTGSTPETGGALTGLIKDQSGHEFITVVSGAGRYTDSKERYQATLDAVSEVLDHYQNQSIDAGQSIPGQKTTKNAWAKGGQVQLVTKEKRTYWIKKSETGKLSFARVKRYNSQSLSDDDTVLSVPANIKASYLTGVSENERNLPLTNKEMVEQLDEGGYRSNWLRFYQS